MTYFYHFAISIYHRSFWLLQLWLPPHFDILCHFAQTGVEEMHRIPVWIILTTTWKFPRFKNDQLQFQEPSSHHVLKEFVYLQSSRPPAHVLGGLAPQLLTPVPADPLDPVDPGMKLKTLTLAESIVAFGPGRRSRLVFAWLVSDGLVLITYFWENVWPVGI